MPQSGKVLCSHAEPAAADLRRGYELAAAAAREGQGCDGEESQRSWLGDEGLVDALGDHVGEERVSLWRGVDAVVGEDS